MTDPLLRNCADDDGGCDALAGEACREVYGPVLDRAHPIRIAMAGREWEPDDWDQIPATSYDWVSATGRDTR